MEIKYSERKVRNNFLTGLLFIGIGLTTFIWSDTLTIRYFWIFFGILHLATAWYFKKNPYLTIEGKRLTKHAPPSRSIEIDEIIKVRKFVNSYKIETSDKTLTIDKNVMEFESLHSLTDFLDALELKDFRAQAQK